MKSKALLGSSASARRNGAQIALAWALRQPRVIAIPKASDLDHVRENAAAVSIKLTAEDLATTGLPIVPKEAAFADCCSPLAGVSGSSGRFQRRQIDFTVLARERHLSPAAALVLLHARDAMIARLIHLGFPIAGIDRQPLFIAEECVTRFVLTAGGVGILSPSSSGHQRSGAFMGSIGDMDFIPDMGFIGSIVIYAVVAGGASERPAAWVAFVGEESHERQQ